MEAFIQILSNNSYVIYTNKKLKINQSLKYGYIEYGVNYYFATYKGLINFKKLNIKYSYLKRNISNKILKTELLTLI